MSYRIFAFLFLVPFLALGQPNFIEHTVSTEIQSPTGIHASDLDLDGQYELIISDYNGDAGYILSGSGDTWTAETLADPLDGANEFNSGDFDGDGDPDLCAAVYTGGTVETWKNNGGTWAQYGAGSYPFARRVMTGDINGDGDVDIVSCSASQGVWWWKNEAGGETWMLNTVYTSGDFQGVDLKDMDGDGDLDIITGGPSNNIRWSENDGTGSFTHHTITQSGNGPKDVFAADIDGDGDMDVVVGATLSDQVLWYENNGSDPWPSHVIDYSFDYPTDVEVADLDMDGDLDVIGVAYYGAVVRWWEQRTNGSFEQHDIQINFQNALKLAVADMDGDGDLDIASASYNTNVVTWWEQEGTPSPVQFTLTPQASVVPPSGGNVVYDASLVSSLPSTIPGLSYWTYAQLPNQQVVGPLSRINFTHTPFMNVTVTGLTLSVPAAAPAGDYLLIGRIGFYPNAQAEASFPFTKSGVQGRTLEGAELVHVWVSEEASNGLHRLNVERHAD